MRFCQPFLPGHRQSLQLTFYDCCTAYPSCPVSITARATFEIPSPKVPPHRSSHCTHCLDAPATVAASKLPLTGASGPARPVLAPLGNLRGFYAPGTRDTLGRGLERHERAQRKNFLYSTSSIFGPRRCPRIRGCPKRTQISTSRLG